MSVREAQRQIDSHEFSEWFAFDSIDPIGDVRGDLQTARICEWIAAAGGAKNVKLDDVLLKFDGDRKPRPKLMKTSANQMKLMFQLAGVKVIDKRPGHGGSR